MLSKDFFIKLILKYGGLYKVFKIILYKRNQFYNKYKLVSFFFNLNVLKNIYNLTLAVKKWKYAPVT